MRVGRERDHDAVDPMRVHQLTKLARRPEELERRPAVRVGSAVVVDEANDVEPVAPVLPHLLGKRGVRRCPNRRSARSERMPPDVVPPKRRRTRKRETNPIAKAQNTTSRSSAGGRDRSRRYRRGRSRCRSSRPAGRRRSRRPRSDRSAPRPGRRARRAERGSPIAEGSRKKRTNSHCGTTVSTLLGADTSALGDEKRRHEPNDIRQQQEPAHQPAATRPPRRCASGPHSRRMLPQPPVRQHSRSPPPNSPDYRLCPRYRLSRLTRAPLHCLSLPSAQYSPKGGTPTPSLGSIRTADTDLHFGEGTRLGANGIPRRPRVAGPRPGSH